jgi:amphi-Trp domain-containing protein
MSRKGKRDMERTCSAPEFVAALRRLADALEEGKRFTIGVAGERITVPARAVFSRAHEREDGNEELEFQLTWMNE